ncbi:MAG: ArnT family glycosyltransferase [Solirubrobacteraceae bacterium]
MELTKTDRRWLWGTLLLALSLRLVLLLLTPGYRPFGDPSDYDQLARSLVDHHQYTSSAYAALGSATAYRPPAYPYFLAGVYEIFGQAWTAGRIAGAVLGTGTVFLVWELARRVAGQDVARWAGLVAALAPPLAWTSTGLVSENLYLPLLLGAVLLILRHRARPAGRLPILAGLVLGAVVLTRSNAIVVLVPLLAGIWPARRRWQDAGLLLAGFVIALVPWTIRNAVVMDTFAPLGTQSGISMAGVLNEGATGSAYYGVWRPPDKVAALAPYVRRPDIDETRLDSKLRHLALDFAGDHPSYLLHVTYHHVWQLLELRDVRITSSNSQREFGMPTGFARKTSRGGALLLMALALAGAFTLAARRRLWRREHVWLWAVPVLVTVTLLPLVGAPRYRLSLDPFLCVFAGAALLAVVHKVRGRDVA